MIKRLEDELKRKTAAMAKLEAQAAAGPHAAGVNLAASSRVPSRRPLTRSATRAGAGATTSSRRVVHVDADDASQAEGLAHLNAELKRSKERAETAIMRETEQLRLKKAALKEKEELSVKVTSLEKEVNHLKLRMLRKGTNPDAPVACCAHCSKGAAAATAAAPLAASAPSARPGAAVPAPQATSATAAPPVARGAGESLVSPSVKKPGVLVAADDEFSSTQSHATKLNALMSSASSSGHKFTSKQKRSVYSRRGQPLAANQPKRGAAARRTSFLQL